MSRIVYVFKKMSIVIDIPFDSEQESVCFPVSEMGRDQDFRDEVARRLGDEIKQRHLSKKAAAQTLEVSRQILDLYLKAKVTPRPEVLRRACKAWPNLVFRFRDHVFSVTHFEQSAPAPNSAKQLSLFEALNSLQKENLKISIAKHEPQSLELSVRIEFAS